MLRYSWTGQDCSCSCQESNGPKARPPLPSFPLGDPLPTLMLSSPSVLSDTQAQHPMYRGGPAVSLDLETDSKLHAMKSLQVHTAPSSGHFPPAGQDRAGQSGAGVEGHVLESAPLTPGCWQGHNGVDLLKTVLDLTGPYSHHQHRPEMSQVTEHNWAPCP